MAPIRRLVPQKRLDPLQVFRSVLAAQSRRGADFAQAWSLGRQAALGVAATHSRLDVEVVAEALDQARHVWEQAYRGAHSTSAHPIDPSPSGFNLRALDEPDPFYGVPRARRVA
jgi:hypothetical protein